MVSLSTPSAVLNAIEHARAVTFAAYLLPRGAIRDALEDAARSGSRVQVRLEAAPYGSGAGGIAQLNKQAIKELRKSGVDARLTHRPDTGLHIKAAVCDGIAYFDDRNWAAHGAQ